MSEEDYLYDQIRLLRIEYEKAIQPLIDRLATLRSLRPLEPITVPFDSLPDFLREKL